MTKTGYLQHEFATYIGKTRYCGEPKSLEQGLEFELSGGFDANSGKGDKSLKRIQEQKNINPFST